MKATVTVTAVERSGKPTRDTRAVDFFFVKNGDWQIQTVTVWEKQDGA